MEVWKRGFHTHLYFVPSLVFPHLLEKVRGKVTPSVERALLGSAERMPMGSSPSVVLAAVAIAAVVSCEPTCEGVAPTSLSGTYFAHERALLALQTAQPPPSDLRVAVRGRPGLTYSHRDELPEFISGPTSPSFPLLVEAGALGGVSNATSAPSVATYATAAKALLEEHLLTYGAVRFRGLPLADGIDFSEFVSALEWHAVKLGGGGTQREDVTANVRTASEEPPTQTIEPHMDMAHSVAHPDRIAFFCAAGPPPGAGGETVLTNMRAVHADMVAQGVAAEFERRGGVAYIKRLWDATRVQNNSYTWQKFFFTDDLERALAEVRKRDGDARAGEHGDGVIDFREVLPAVVPHPKTGEPAWFNGIHTNHASYYVEAAHVDTSDGPPMHTAFADGTPIPEATVAAIRASYWRNSAAIRCETGDLIVVDNMLASHGRMSWTPGEPRKMLLTHFHDAPAATA